METPNNWEGRENERLSRYDESNESNPRNYSLSDAKNQYRNETRPTDHEPYNDERYENSYGMGSDSSRSLLMRGNEMVFENDHEGQELDDVWDAAQRDERQETYEEERRRLETERKYGGFDTRV